jgi:hypothetical protein
MSVSSPKHDEQGQAPLRTLDYTHTHTHTHTQATRRTYGPCCKPKLKPYAFPKYTVATALLARTESIAKCTRQVRLDVRVAFVYRIYISLRKPRLNLDKMFKNVFLSQFCH